VELSLDISTPLGLNQLIQMSIGQLANFAAGLLDIPSHTVAIYLRQSSPVAAPLLGEEPAFQAVAFGADSDYIRVPAHCLDKKPYRDEGALLKHLQEYTQLLQQRYPGSLQDQVRDIIGQALPSGECSIERVAATLDLHPRVLQKRLQQQGTSYVQLLQETRLCMAKEYLRMRKVSITDLALNLGYADVSVFSRSFKRLTGMSARQWQSLYGATR
jgi:AraC-like DNA-binding protein